MFSNLDNETINLIEKEYQSNSIPWSLGFSGGKDSSALLKLVFNALIRITNPHKPVNIVYCDTGMDIPLVANHVNSTLESLKREVEEFQLPIKVIVVKPSIENRYFSKIIGHGYPTPTNKFRWCTDKLRVNPIQSVIESKSNNIILLGVRNGESQERDRVISRYKTQQDYYLNQFSFPNTKLFTPIINYDLKDVWYLLKTKQPPFSIDGIKLESLYSSKSLDRTDLIDAIKQSFHKGRFGCWACTVVRKDHALMNLISNGYNDLIPLLNFRDWIIKYRDDPKNRCSLRRNGSLGPGPFTLAARKTILNKLLYAQSESGIHLISESEIDYIKSIWQIDMNSTKYHE